MSLRQPVGRSKILSFVFVFAVLCATSAVAQNDVAVTDSNICRNKTDVCHHGRCISAPLEAEQYVCKCETCFGGPKCDENICDKHKKQEFEITPVTTFNKVVRILLVIFTILDAILALCYFMNERHRQNWEKKHIRKYISVDSSEISHVSTHREAPNKNSYCENLYSTATGRLISFKDETAIQATPSMTTFNVVSLNRGQAPAGKTAWDEVEMRRHGLVDRYCYRPDDVAPKSIDVSVYERPLPTSSRRSTIGVDSKTLSKFKTTSCSTAKN
ncbi:hypothetical protein L596_028867 [Steinernema carpocapsae]|uniref:EGF-like domain-containing protein n=1 Tax=Steinernema carpocapsae TaxID=34508 RepID=A0A4U5LZL7_STECR|nr:hypothetical protein L596_028867 [Steinernema carpocapsae]